MAPTEKIEFDGGQNEEARSKAKERERLEKLQNLTRERKLKISIEQANVYREALIVLNESCFLFWGPHAWQR